MIEVRPVTPEFRAAVLTLTVHPDQADFCGQMPGVLETGEADPLCEPMAIVEDGQVVGFYRLDFNPGAIAGRDFGVPSVGLRAYIIDAAYQGRGLGTRALTALVADLRGRHPDRQALALSVNFRNAVALKTYERSDFVRDPEPYLGGRFGPQHVLIRPLNP